MAVADQTNLGTYSIITLLKNIVHTTVLYCAVDGINYFNVIIYNCENINDTSSNVLPNLC